MRLAALLLVLAIAPAVVFAQDTTGVGAIRGTVRTAADVAAADVAVCVPALSRCAVSDARGVFRLGDLRAGRYTLEIVAAGQPAPLLATIDVRAGLDSVIEVALPATGALQETVVVSAPAYVTAEEVKNSAFLIPARDIIQGAGALQDIARYVQTLPGVVIGTDDFRNDLIVRGGSPLENLYIVDNVEIPNINTFANFASAGGTVSILDAQLIQDVTFLTGGFPASYGNRTSSVLQTSLREGSRERLAGRATVGFAGAGVVAEGPLAGGRGSWIASARRTFIDLVTDDVGFGGVPVQYTLNGKVVLDVTPRDRVWALNVSGVDNVRLGLTEDSDLSEGLSNLDITYEGWRSATGVNWQRTFGTRGVALFGASHAGARVQQRVLDLLRNGVPPVGTPVEAQIAAGETVFRENSGESETTVKADITAYLPGIEKVQAGVSVKRLGVDYEAASPFGSDSPYFPDADQNPFALRERLATTQAGGYVQASRPLGDRLTMTAGLRLDRYGFVAETRLSPRIGASYALTDAVSLRASGGRFYQLPFLLFLTAFPENRDLVPFRADHLVGGVVWSPDESTRVTVEGYDKRYAEYPVSSQIASLSLANIGDTFDVRQILFPLVSAGSGTARGVEVSAERQPGAESSWAGQANLALSRTRHAGSDGVQRPGSFDYPVVANVLGSYRLSPRWDVGLRLTYLGGRPFTPFDAARSLAQRRAVYDLAQVNAARVPVYFRADVRVDRRFTIGGRAVTVFAGVQNVTNRKNVSGFVWDRRNNRSRVQEQLGVFPILGLDWAF